MRLSFLICILMLCATAMAQLQLENANSVAYYLHNHLVGQGVEVSNIQFNNQPADSPSPQLGYYNSEYANVGLESGLILSNGDINSAIGPNNWSAITLPELGLNLGGDEDLSELSGLNTFDAAVLEFDFIPTGDSLVFEFVFASEEYPEFSESIFNDAFGFFISGPGIEGSFSSPSEFPNGAINLATIPNTDIPITISTVNNGEENQGPCINCEYFIANGDGNSSPENNSNHYIQYDGILVPITVKIGIDCGELYHIKLAIADSGDDGYDSAVFFKEGSFQTNASYTASIENGIQDSSEIPIFYEGCLNGQLNIHRASYWNHPETLELSNVGVANSGTDYTNLPSTITFAQNQSSVSLDIQTIADQVIESDEHGIISISQQICNSTISEEVEFFILDEPDVLSANYNAPGFSCTDLVSIQAEGYGGLGFYEYAWSNGQSGDSIALNFSEAEALILTVSDTCSSDISIPVSLNTEIAPPLEVSINDNYNTVCGENQIQIYPEIQGGYGELEYEWSIDGEVYSSLSTFDFSLDDNALLSLSVRDECDSEVQLETQLNHQPYVALSLEIEVDPVLCFGMVHSLNATATNGQEPYLYQWSASDIDSSSIEVSLNHSSVVMLELSDACGHSISEEAFLSVDHVDASFLVEELSDFQLKTANTSSSSLGNDLAYNWTLEGSFLGSSRDIQTSFLHEEAHLLELIVSDEHSCVDSTSVLITPQGALFVPTAFSPNNDQVNDLFEIKGIGIDTYSIVIFDRFGAIVFETNQIEDSWDGGISNSISDNFDTYFYSIEARDSKGNMIQQKGSLTALR